MCVAAALIAVTALSACGLPRSGPSKAEVLKSQVGQGGNARVVYVDDRVVRAASYTPSYGFGANFLSQATVGPDEIRPGDTLGLTIWENVDDGLLTSMGGKNTPLQQLQVDSQGNIFVPYAGRIRAAGNTPDALRRIITERLASQTPDPQVQVTRLAGDGATVTVLGKVGQGVFPLERPTRTLSAMLAKAGGVQVDPEVAVITVKRGGRSGKVWLKDLYANPKNDIALRPGDVIVVDEDTRNFIALGALGGQTKVPLGSDEVSALEAIAMVGGLSSQTADPTGVFILRDEPESVAQRVLGGSVVGDQRIAYVLDLTKPDGLFMARDFAIRDNDTVYVTEAPYVRWQKTLGVITGGANNVRAIESIGN
ncbi:MAG: sugar ABC transporter substrate-binding protein [Paracoccus denitrificans]|nr:MAG: sugar ABC transporter substrate-binding protein [Paracoccus denitrificans]PZO84745.1 MAG: sugar ABC transporter substrate-binding protein [Paracoccus denitrificans]